jgi:outer membrane protein assembly factor BamE (lipoprotein component of BamABCDE complex)
MLKEKSMIRLGKLIVAAAAAASLSGCIIVGGEHGWVHSDWEKEQRRNSERISQLDIGMERVDVIDRMGSPDFSEAYTRDDAEYRVLFYRTQRRHGDGATTRDETTPLVFRNDTLVGWGDEVYASMK